MGYWSLTTNFVILTSLPLLLLLQYYSITELQYYSSTVVQYYSILVLPTPNGALGLFTPAESEDADVAPGPGIALNSYSLHAV